MPQVDDMGVLLAHAASTLYLVGLIWMVQAVRNWLRTALWTARGALALFLLQRALRC
jgi:hypothetical protein